jgi:glutamyl-Q tRNA(Asp) synthetase
MHYCGRFAPSPTGPLHFGSLVAAVGSYLEARRRDGRWLLRIEDLDPPRVVPGVADAIMRTLDVCGLHWDGSVIRQSARHDAYHAALHLLRQRGALYPCACSRREIADSATHGIDGAVYPGTCRGGLPAGRPARALRVLTDGATPAFDDAVQGGMSQRIEADVGDFVVYRCDGVFAYQLAVAVDDGELGITDVVRGADLLDSTPRQIFLQQLLGLPTPRYAHLPVAVDADGEKHGKQTRAAPIDTAAPAAALTAALEFLGQSPPPQLKRASITECWQWAIEHWQLQRVPRRRTMPAPGAVE